VSLLEAASMLATFDDFGQQRQPQLIRAIGAEPESAAARMVVKAISPEVAYLSLSLSLSEQTPAVVPRHIAREATVARGNDAWTALGTPDAVLVVWVGYLDGHSLPVTGEAERASVAIAHGVLAVLLHGHPQPLLPRPATLVERRVEGGHLLPSSSHGGSPEWFVPGSLPREEPVAPPPEKWGTENDDAHAPAEAPAP
jgi:membrane peptidoglycan carboxypeptidase